MNVRPERPFWVHTFGGSMCGPYRTAEDAGREGRQLTAGGFVVWNGWTNVAVSVHPPQAEEFAA